MSSSGWTAGKEGGFPLPPQESQLLWIITKMSKCELAASSSNSFLHVASSPPTHTHFSGWNPESDTDRMMASLYMYVCTCMYMYIPVYMHTAKKLLYLGKTIEHCKVLVHLCTSNWRKYTFDYNIKIHAVYLLTFRTCTYMYMYAYMYTCRGVLNPSTAHRHILWVTHHDRVIACNLCNVNADSVYSIHVHGTCTYMYLHWVFVIQHA